MLNIHIFHTQCLAYLYFILNALACIAIRRRVNKLCSVAENVLQVGGIIERYVLCMVVSSELTAASFHPEGYHSVET